MICAISISHLYSGTGYTRSIKKIITTLMFKQMLAITQRFGNATP